MKNEQIYAYLGRLNNLMHTSSMRNKSTHNLQPVQLEALYYLSQCNRYSDTPMGVTEYLGKTKGTISQTLKVLEKKGYITKNSDSKDKRISHLSLTNSGELLLEETVKTSQFNEAYDALPATSKTEINRALNTLLTQMLKSNDVKSFGVCHSCKFNMKKDDGEFFCNLVKEPLSFTDVDLICREHEFVSYN